MDSEAGRAIEWNDEASKALRDIFGNPAILNRILEQLPNSKLLELSLVSKFWKKEARIVMKKRGNVTARLERNKLRGCGQVFQAFAANLETLNEDLYSGMSIGFSSIWKCQGTGALELGAIHESILAGMKGNLKSLSIRLFNLNVCWNNARDCPNFLLLRLLLRDFIGDLEHLTLKIREITEPFIQQFLPPGPYPKLKVLKLNDNWTLNEETFGNQIRMLLSRAPNLKEIHTDGFVSLRENLMEGREGVVHVYGSHVNNAVEDISENVIPALRLKRISFNYSTEPEVELGRFNEKAQCILRTCCAATLKTLNLNAVSAVLLMSYGIQLVNVKELQIGIDYAELEQFEPRILSILSRFDFTYLFPNLKRVGIYMCLPMLNLGELSRDIMDAIIEQANAGRAEPTLPLAGNIKHLRLYQDSISVAAVQYFAHMFPAIQELHSDTQDGDFPVESSWELWPELQLMEVGEEQYQRP